MKTSNTLIFRARQPYEFGNTVPTNHTVINFSCLSNKARRINIAKRYGYTFGWVIRLKGLAFCLVLISTVFTSCEKDTETRPDLKMVAPPKVIKSWNVPTLNQK